MNIYDFDKTIYAGDSSIDFYLFCLKKYKKMLFLIPGILLGFVLYYLKFKSKEYFKEKFFSFLKFIPDIEKEVKLFWKCNEYKIKDFYLKKHKKSDIIISASPEFLLKYLADKMQFSLYASKVNKKNGKFEEKNCYGEEKKRILNENGIFSCCEFYSDSLSDAPLSKMANKAYLVKGNKIKEWK